MRIQPYDSGQLDAVVQLSIRAWAPVFESLQAIMDSEVYREFFPDWRASQEEAVKSACAAQDTHVWVAIDGGSTVGFVAVKFHRQSNMGEIHMIAVDPDYHRGGIGTALTEFALERMKEAGAAVAMVETGGDPGHVPARGLYEKAGFSVLQVARYFKKL